ncbi:DNA primase [Hippea jasoniae]|uniref:DNA primase n=1 Tax=Hippea jasoniae TaxID=944479 RepID=UPI00068B812F|nr:DNA primase [Hippea jasoniae]
MGDVAEFLKSQIDIVDVVSQYVQLKKRGSNYFGLCPFHNEKTPSFSVNPKGQFFHCFGCGESGDVITFLMKIENLTFKEAIKELARRYNIPISFEEKTQHDFLYEIHSIAAAYFQEKLLENKQALEYLKKRGIFENTIESFKIGFAPDSRQLEKILIEKGFNKNQLLNSGIFFDSKTGLINRFRNRIIFPIFDVSDRVIAFGGRVINSNNTAKYINSPETVIFSKQKTLFGLNFAKDEIKKQKATVITEGYMDCIKLHSKGIKNSVATLGTALSKFHINNLSRYCEAVYLNYDADEAGFKAMMRSAVIVLSSKTKAFVVVLDKDEDPDSFIEKYGKDAYIDKLKNAKEYFNYIVEFLKNRYDLDEPSSKLKAIEQIKPIIFSISDPILKASYISKTASLFNVSENIFLNPSKEISIPSTLTPQEAFLSIVLGDIELLAWVEDLEGFADNLEGIYKSIYLKLVSYYLSGEEFDISKFEVNLTEDEKKIAYRLLQLQQMQMQQRYERRKVLIYLLKQFEIKNLKKQLKIMQNIIKKEPTEENFKKYNEIFSKLKGVVSEWSG